MKAQTKIYACLVSAMLLGSHVLANALTPVALGQRQTMVHLDAPKRYVLLPVEEAADEAQVSIVADNITYATHNVRLAVSKVDYYVPLSLAECAGKNIALLVRSDNRNLHSQSANATALCWREMQLTDTVDLTNREQFRPQYHFAPQYGWMNDPNGMVYLNGVWHLFYQHNPYGSMWGNMHWGHATSADLIHWQHQPTALAPDAWGAIFSGSCVIDKNNVAGFGKNAMVAFYTSAGESQSQSIAYSTDGGKTFSKYGKNPVLCSAEQDFRDPKVIWHEATQRWVMVLAVGQRMQFFTSKNLKDWKYESDFGKGYGNHDGVWECPDLLELTVEGTNEKRWVLICNINPGGPFGGSATQYFVGDFNGSAFTCQSAPATTKWLDYGKDHYAAVTWSNAPQNRTVSIAWMSNWQYANNVPTKQFRSANSLPRELNLFAHNGEIYLKSAPVVETEKLFAKSFVLGKRTVGKAVEEKAFGKNAADAMRLNLKLKNRNAERVHITLANELGQKVVLTYDFAAQKCSFDRTQSGLTTFSNEFSAITSTPTFSAAKEVEINLFIDKASIEIFGDGGRWAMTNIVYPDKRYGKLSYQAENGKCDVQATVYNTIQ